MAAPVAARVVVLVWGDLAAATEAVQGLAVEATAKGCSVLEATVTAKAGMEGAAMGTAETMEEETAATKAMAAVVMATDLEMAAAAYLEMAAAVTAAAAADEERPPASGIHARQAPRS